MSFSGNVIETTNAIRQLERAWEGRFGAAG